MSLLLKLIEAIWDFVIGAVVDFFRWARKPGAKLKMVCGVLAFVTAIAAMRAFEAEQAVIRVAQQCEADKGVLTLDIATRDARLDEVRENARREREARNAQILRAQAMQIEAERRAKAAEASLAAFEREYENKPDACTDALAHLKAACPTLGDY